MQPVSKYETAAGRRVYAVPVCSFPELVTNVYVISDGDQLIMIDVGSGFGEANQELLDGLAAIGERFGETIALAELDAILITHGHIDHFGALPFARQFSDAPIGVHPLDRRVLSSHEERLAVAARRLDNFLEGAGVVAGRRAGLMEMYRFSKALYRSVEVQFALEPGPLGMGGIVVHHVPGHCPGQVCLQVDDLLLTADHILAKTTPHQAPESITNNMGLGHYLDSLAKIQSLEGIRLGLGGHEAPMPDLKGRIDEIRRAHELRLNKVLAICREPCSIAEISKALFGPVQSYHVLLALEETGAHVEYLYQRGELVVVNVEEVERNDRPVYLYQRD